MLEARGVREAVHVHEQTGSTNDDAKGHACAGAPAGTLVVADTQTAGRGRQGNSWHSPPRVNLYASVVLRPRVQPAAAPRFALVAGVVIARACASLVETTLLVKWPNDVVVSNGAWLSKLAGVLVETQIRGAELGALVVGFGVNVHLRTLPEELAQTATSLALLGAEQVSREDLAAQIVGDLVAATARFEAEGLAPWTAELASRDALYGRALSVGDLTGMGDGIEPDGALRIRSSVGRLARVVAGHVELH